MPNGQPENIRTSHIVQAEKAVLMVLGIYMFICTYMCVATLGKEVMNLKESNDRYMGRLEGEEGREKFIFFKKRRKPARQTRQLVACLDNKGLHAPARRCVWSSKKTQSGLMELTFRRTKESDSGGSRHMKVHKTPRRVTGTGTSVSGSSCPTVHV